MIKHKLNMIIFLLVTIIMSSCNRDDIYDFARDIVPKKAITYYRFTSALNPSLPYDVTGIIDEGAKTIKVSVPSGTSTTLIATFGTNGVNVVAAGVQQVSGSTSNSFSGSVVYRVTASDNTTQDYTVSVIIASNTQTFSFTGSEQSFIVPAGVNTLFVDVIGAQGDGNQNISLGYGKGGRVQAMINVIPGEILYIYVGGQSGYNGGGTASTSGAYRSLTGCGNGGGASDIRIGDNSLNNRIAVAGGGGGGPDGSDGYGGEGGGSGMTAHDGNASSPPGADGTQTYGGAGGGGAYGGTYGAPGSFGQGGDNGTAAYLTTGAYQAYGNGGGGGGGYYGGGGGGSGISGAGGGGGSSLVPAGGVSTPGYQTGNGTITIEW